MDAVEATTVAPPPMTQSAIARSGAQPSISSEAAAAVAQTTIVIPVGSPDLDEKPAAKPKEGGENGSEKEGEIIGGIEVVLLAIAAFVQTAAKVICEIPSLCSISPRKNATEQSSCV